ncbi:MAG: lactate racemase domain-containing protein [Gemmataceae bacterium]
MPFPKLVRLVQRFERPRVEDIPGAVTEQLSKLNLEKSIRPGQTIALTAGSRGIANIPEVLRAVAAFLKKMGAKPFFVPAMGSHGGGTADGQRHILESYGITETAIEAPIKASMEVVLAGTTTEGYSVYLDRYASQADHIGVIGRVKPHTGYHGPIESGLMKMMMIGLGKHEGALACHRILLERPFDQVVRSVGRTLRAKTSIALGLALVENAYDETALVAAVQPDDFEQREEELLVIARRLLARLPVQEADLLIIDEIGKDISGSGMDTNIVGRKRAFGNTMPNEQPRMRFIFVRGLSEKTHGNATGIGLADFTTARLVKAMDYRSTVINSLTAGYPENANLPVHFDTDREVVEAALKIIGLRTPEQGRLVWIRNTKHLGQVIASEACLDNLLPHATMVSAEGPRELAFDRAGNLVPWQLG